MPDLPVASAIEPNAYTGSVRRRWLLTCCVGAVAGGAAWLIYEQTHGQLRVDEMVRSRAESARPSSDDMSRFRAAEERVATGRTMLAYGLVAACVAAGSGLGLGRPVAGRHGKLLIGKAIALAALGGLVGGAVAPHAIAFLPAEDHIEPVQRAIAIQAVAWMLAGAGVGWASAIHQGRGCRKLASSATGAACGLIAALLFIPLAGIVLPESNVDFAVPRDAPGRFLWSVCGALALAAGWTAALAPQPSASESEPSG
ncbi:MAG: hypothetical protein AB7F89_21190 [Pirellulaceae bacterium]